MENLCFLKISALGKKKSFFIISFACNLSLIKGEENANSCSDLIYVPNVVCVVQILMFSKLHLLKGSLEQLKKCFEVK